MLFTVLLASCSVYSKPQKVGDYLYSIEYSKYDFESMRRLADFLMYGKKKLPRPACSAVRRDSIFGRNFDWLYDETPEFVIRTSSTASRYASIGVAVPVSVLKDRQVKGLWGAFILDKLPAFTVDGINEKGVACCINMAPQGDCGCTVGTNPGKDRMYSSLLVRYVLDNAASVEEAIELIGNRDIYTTTAFGLREDYHFMISDSVRTVVVEFVNNRPVVLEDSCIMTNFNLARGVTLHALGLERYDILSRGYGEAGTVEGMFGLLGSVRFSGMYRQPDGKLWLSELCSINEKYGLTTEDMKSAPEKFIGPFEKERELFRNRSRKTSKTWHTTHTSVYNLNAGTLSVCTQEGDVTVYFKL